MAQRMLGQNLASRIAGIEQKANDFSVVPITYKGDWYEISEPVEYFASSVSTYALVATNTSHGDFTKLFSKGDPIRLKQGGEYQYFHVNGVFSNGLYIFTGSNYSLIDSPITDFAKGLKIVPTDFPDYFEWDPIPVGGFPGTMTVAVNSTFNNRFSVIGKRFILALGQDLTLGGTPTANILINTPLSVVQSGFTGQGATVITMLNAGSYQVGQISFGSSIVDPRLVITNLDLTAFSAGQLTYNISFEFTF